MASVYASIIGQAFASVNSGSGSLSYDTGTTGFVGAGGQICVIKFTTLDFPGVSTSVSFNLNCGFVAPVPTVYWAICSSDENYASYIGVTSVINDSNQLAHGTLYNNGALYVETGTLKKQENYYLILWVPSYGSYVNIGESKSHEVAVSWSSKLGVVRIGNGTSYDKYLCFIDNGTTWLAYMPCIDNGTSFESLHEYFT